MSSPIDHDARTRAVSRRDRSLLVEASAGTGKTHTIIQTILEVCVRRTPRLPLTCVAATTFTEKAAGELKSRLRADLEKLARTGETPEIAAAARASLEELDRAQVGTIHGFCFSVLAERPIEAGLVPRFTLLAPEASHAFACAVWEEWWRAEIEDRPEGALGRALLAGMRIAGGEKETTIGKLAADLYENRARLDGATLPPANAARVAARARSWTPVLDGLIALAESAKHRVAGTLLEIRDWSKALPDDFDGLAAAAGQAPKISFKGTRAIPEIVEWRKSEYQPFVERLGKARYEPLLVDLLHRLVEEPGGYLNTVARRKGRESRLDFDDLLLATRDLLRRSPAARRHFRARYRLIVVDEFQDTDPIQMEIFLRLAHAEGGGEDWTTLAPEPGRLVIVGDPKQSIYRFRRADLESYTLVRNLLRDDREVFEANRRSVAPILGWVNAVFAAAMPAPATRPFDAPYARVEPWGVRPLPEGKRVVYLDPPADWRADGETRHAAEAAAVAAFLADALARQAFQVREGEPAKPGDIAVLVRSNDAIGRMQEALASAGLDTVVEGGRDFFRREEPAAVLAALRAIDDPDDAIALYAALKSFLFAFSDEDLFLAAADGARFDYRRAALATGALSEALALCANLHRRRQERPASETVIELLAETAAFIKARARRVGGLQAEANLHQLVSLARELEPAAASFADVVRGLASIEDAEASEPRAFEESPDAVHLLTVHKSKGLEFPIVVLADFGSERPPAREALLIPHRAGPWGVAARIGAETVGTPDLDAIRTAENDRAASEMRRLLYVAATRAEDWLIVSRWRKITETASGIHDAFDRTPLVLFGPVCVPADLEPFVEVRSAPTGPRPPRARRRRANPAAAEALRRNLDEIPVRAARREESRSAPLRRAGGDHARAEDQPALDRAPAEQPSVAVRIGCAVHQAMEVVVRGGDPVAAARRAALEWELDIHRHPEIAAMVETLRRSPLVASGSRRIPEFPVVFRSPDDGALVEGKIDLLIEGADGWTIVDYKTDRLERLGGAAGARAHFEGYRPQLSEYATALAILGVPVVRACVLSARTGETFDLLRINPSSPPPPAGPRRG